MHIITEFIKVYLDRLHEMRYVHKTSYQRDSLGFCGDANKNFPTFLFTEQSTGIHFLKTSDQFAVRCCVAPAEVIWFTVNCSIPFVNLDTRFTHDVASCVRFPWAIPPKGVIRFPSRALHVHGEVQDTRDVSVHSIHCHRCIYRLLLQLLIPGKSRHLATQECAFSHPSQCYFRLSFRYTGKHREYNARTVGCASRRRFAHCSAVVQWILYKKRKRDLVEY